MQTDQPKTSLKSLRKLTAIALSAALLAGSAGAISTADPASAACKGSDSRKVVGATGGTNPTERYEVRMNSCSAKKLLKATKAAPKVSAVAGALGSAWWPVSFSTAPVIIYAWNNEAKLSKCTKPGTGVAFTETNGVIGSCKPQ